MNWNSACATNTEVEALPVSTPNRAGLMSAIGPASGMSSAAPNSVAVKMPSALKAVYMKSEKK